MSGWRKPSTCHQEKETFISPALYMHRELSKWVTSSGLLIHVLELLLVQAFHSFVKMNVKNLFYTTILLVTEEEKKWPIKVQHVQLSQTAR